MDSLHTLAILLPLSLTSGINLYATILVVGLSIRFHWVTNTPTNLDILAEWPIIIFAVLLYIIEFVADKIPFADNLWDIIQTFIRPVGGALIGLAALGKVDPVLGLLGMLAAGTIAFSSHSGKASARLALNIVSPAENFTNIGVSLAEDLAVGGLAFLALKFPYLAAGIAFLLLLIFIFLAPILIGWIIFLVQAISARLGGIRQRNRPSDTLPASHLVWVNQQPPDFAVACKSQGIPRKGGRNGFVMLWNNELIFTYDRWTRSHAWRIPRMQITATSLHRKALVDVLEVHYFGNKRRNRVARFIFLKNRSNLAAYLETILQTQGKYKPI